MFRLTPWILISVLFTSLSAAAQTGPVEQLSRIRLDKSQIYGVRDITLNRDALSISLNRGAIAFTESIEGKITGAVFIGSGDILAIPPDPIEKKQLFRYTRSALLNEHFETAVFRFTDETWEEILKQQSRHATESVDAADVDALLRWELEVQRRGAFLNERILTDLIGSKSRPFFLAQIEGKQLGWFDAIYDERRVEEIFIQQHTAASTAPLVWASFHKRSESREPAAVAHEDKFLFDLLSVDSTTGVVRLKFRADGERVLSLPFTSAGVTSVALNGSDIPLLRDRDQLAVILPAPSQSGVEVTLGVQLAPETRPLVPADAVRENSLTGASYRDQWIIEGLANYGQLLSDPSMLVQARAQLLATSPEGGSYESLGPVWIGFRMSQPRSAVGDSVIRSKSVWILHMLRNVLQQDAREPLFGRFLSDVLATGRGGRISTFDFKRLAEKHASRPLDWFFDSWVFGTGIPTYAITSKVEPSANGFVITGNITQSGVPDTFEMPVPVFGDGVFLGNVIVDSDGGEFRFTSATRPQQVLVDPNGTILTGMN